MLPCPFLKTNNNDLFHLPFVYTPPQSYKQSGFPSSVVFCSSAQVAVRSCGQGSRMRSFYTLSETGSGGEVWMVTASSKTTYNGWSYANQGCNYIPLNLFKILVHEIGQHTLCGMHGSFV